MDWIFQTAASWLMEVGLASIETEVYSADIPRRLMYGFLYDFHGECVHALLSKRVWRAMPPPLNHPVGKSLAHLMENASNRVHVPKLLTEYLGPKYELITMARRFSQTSTPCELWHEIKYDLLEELNKFASSCRSEDPCVDFSLQDLIPFCARIGTELYDPPIEQALQVVEYLFDKRQGNPWYDRLGTIG